MMTVGSSVTQPGTPVCRFGTLVDKDRLEERLRAAEDRAASLECALASNRRIGIAIGILMCRGQFTADDAIAILKSHSQHCNVKVRVLAETVIHTGML